MSSARLIKFVLIPGGVLVALVLWFTIARPVVVLPRMQLAPGYGLQDARGQLVTSEDQRGVLVLYSFAYSRCQATCSKLYKTLQTVDEELAKTPDRKPPFRFITLTVDPTRDTPQQLAQFKLPFEPKAVPWTWLSGTEQRMKDVVGGGFELYYQPQADGSVAFAPAFVLVDGFGVVRAEYDAYEISSRLLLEHIELLYKEIEQSSGLGSLAYEAAHFFACYPH